MKRIESEKIPIYNWAEDIDEKTLRQARNIANLPGAFHSIAIMPDAHVGYGMPIGGVLATEDIIIPNAVGVDIGCGMIAAKTDLQEISQDNLWKILNKLKEIIPTGFRHHKKPQDWEGFDRAPDVPIIQKELDSARRQIGTLGGGNHFIEILQEVSDSKWGIEGMNNIWLMIHSGSRNFGLKAASAYHSQAKEYCQRKGIELMDRDLSFLPFESPDGQKYWEAMNYCQEFAQANRALMMRSFKEVVSGITNAGYKDIIKTEQVHINPSLSQQQTEEDSVWVHHNYAAREKHFEKEVIIHRKGATRARSGQLGIVPGSMGTPSYIVMGLGEPESFMSCAHGAGRSLGRKEANRKLSLEEAQQATSEIVFSGFKGKFDEAPQAYKNIERVIELQKDLAKPIIKLKPIAVMIGS